MAVVKHPRTATDGVIWPHLGDIAFAEPVLHHDGARLLVVKDVRLHEAQVAIIRQRQQPAPCPITMS